MPITEVTSDSTTLTMTVIAEFDAPVERLWHAYTDPRQIEKFWGPPTYPATFYQHDVFPGGLSKYAMTGPEGDVSRGYWEWIDIKAPHSFVVIDGFALDDGSPNSDMPSMRMEFSFESIDAGSRVTTTTYFGSAEELEQLLAMGMDEGMRAAMGQIDEILADLTSFAAGIATEVQILTDTRVRISRVIRGSIEAVWAAFNEPDLLKKWQLGPDGWTMPVCEVGSRVGDTYRTEWVQPDGSGRFGFTGEILEISPPSRLVTTEAMIGMEDTKVINELTLTQAEGGTLASYLITYPSLELRDTILATGMTDGMESSYARMEAVVLG